MRRLVTIAMLTASTLCLPSVSSANTVVIDFSADGTGTTANPNTGELAGSTFTDQGVTVSALYSTTSNGSSGWISTNTYLYRRNAVNDRGLGICDGAETLASCNGSGNVNELDNSGKPELLRLSLPAGFKWISLQLSSLDSNNGTGSEHMRVYGDDNGISGTVGNIGATVLGSASIDVISQMCGGTGSQGGVTCTGANLEPTISIPTTYQYVPYLFLEPYDWTSAHSTDNDFLLYKVTIQSVPEPASMLLLGTGLAALALRRRYLHRSTPLQ